MQEENESKKSEMKSSTWVLLLGIVTFFYALNLLVLSLPVIGEILGVFIDWITTGIITLILYMHGEKYSKTTVISGWVFGMVPVVGQIIPEQILVVVKLYFDWKAKQAVAKAPSVGVSPNLRRKNNSSFPTRGNNVVSIESK